MSKRHVITPPGFCCYRVALHNRNPERLTNKTNSVVLVAILFLIVLRPVLIAQEQSGQERLHFDLSPFLGYRTSIAFPILPSVTGTNPQVVVDASPAYGASFGLRIREEDLVEMRWARQDSYIDAEDITLQPQRQRMTLDQFHLDCSHETFIEDWPSWARPFVIASVGGTHVSSSPNVSLTRFSFGIGGGIRLYASRHFGLKIQAEWVPIVVDPQVSVVCGPGCIVHLESTAVSQGEIFVAPMLRF